MTDRLPEKQQFDTWWVAGKEEGTCKHCGKQVDLRNPGPPSFHGQWYTTEDEIRQRCRMAAF